MTLSLKSQTLLFENYSSEQGISQNSCFSIAQDDNGFMWFGTQDGLNRYDGKQFRTYLPQTQVGYKLPSNYISALYFSTSEKILLVGTIRGACLYDPKRDSLVGITERFPYASVLDTTGIKKIISFNKYEYWIITYNKGLFLLNTNKQTLSSYFSNNGNEYSVNCVVDYQGKIIVAVSNQLFHLQKTPDRYEPVRIPINFVFPEIRELYNYQQSLWIGSQAQACYFINGELNSGSKVNQLPLAATGIGCFTTDPSNQLWIGTRGNGLARYNPAKNELVVAEHNPYDSRSPGKNFVLSLFTDRQGLIWCGMSGSGLAKYDPLKYQFKTISKEPLRSNSLYDNMVFSIYKCKDGAYYVGTQNKGIAAWDRNTNSFFPYTESSRFGVISNTIYAITEDNASNLWIASWGGLIKLNRKDKKLSFNPESTLNTAKKLYSIHKLKKSDSLFITGEDGPVFFSLKDQTWKPIRNNLMSDNSYTGRYIFEDADNIIWICTVGGGLIRYDYEKNSFRIIESVRNYSINARHLYNDGHYFWIATDNGVMVYDSKRDSVIKQIDLNAHNASNVCYAIEKDKTGSFWVSSNTGLYKINPINYKIQNYDIGNGLSFLEFNTACVSKDDDGGLSFGGVGGITTFNPLLLQSNRFSPDPIITGMNVNDQPWKNDSAYSLTKKIELKYDQNFINIYFAATNYSIESKNQFSYRLKRLNDNWTKPDTRNYASYTSLPPGEYVFELRSANSDGIWSKGITSVSIQVLPPWWQTWWFRVGLFLIIGSIITLLVRRRISHIRHEAELKHKMAETEMMALRAQMNPHFIFNCINSIDALIQSNDKYHATVYLNKFAKLIRNILDSSKQNMISLEKDIDTLKLYIELEQLRNENKFVAEVNAEDGLMQFDYKVPPLIIQPFVENAILHGLRNRTDNEGKLSVSITRKNGHLEYVVEDNGVGRFAETNSLKKEKQSYGLQITSDRVKLFNNETNASVEITDLVNNGKAAGTRVKVHLKLK